MRQDRFLSTPGGPGGSLFAFAEQLRQEPGAFFFRQRKQIGGERVEVDCVRGFRRVGASSGASVGSRRRIC
jgi:hypothetical protein